MKNTIGLIILLLFVSINTIYAQCPAVPVCTQTAVTATNYTVNAGDVLCINSTYSGATITLNGGTIIVESGGTLSGAVSMTSGTIHVAAGGTLNRSITPSSTPSVINNCGTLAGTRNFNANMTLNNYSSTLLTLQYGGHVVNNYANNADIRFGTVDVAGGILNNYGTDLNFRITGSWNNGITFNNNAGASMTVVSVPGGSMPASTVFNNSGTSLTYSPVLSTTGATFNNSAGSTLNFTSSGSANSPRITNNGTMNVSGTFYLAGNTTTNNGTMAFSGELRLDGGTLNMGANSTTTTNTLYKNNGSINMNDHSVLNIVQNVTTWNGSAINLVSGCASVMGSTTPSTTNINSNFLNNVNLNFCGSAPAQAPSFIAITAVTNSVSSPGRYRIAMGSGPATNGFVQIAGVTGVTNLNGLWRVINNGDGTWDLIGSSFSAGAVIGSSQVVVDQSKLKLGTGTYLGHSSCTNPCAPLPIKLVSFGAVKENNSVRIVWQTLEETNNDYYSIERSIDGIQYESILTIPGSRNSTSAINYIQYDNDPLAGISYYRLKQVDLDGTFTYSTIAVINFDNTSEWNIYPNPSNDGSVTISSHFSEGDVISVTVTDVTGNRVRYYNSDLYEQKMQISDLSSGLYIVTIQTISVIESKKLVVK